MPTSGRHQHRSWVGLEWAFPGVVVSVVMPFSVSVGNAFEFLISDVIVGIGVWVESVDTFFSRGEHGWLVHFDGGGTSDEGKEFHFVS